jgi:F-type H+-transporting ATPase subunit b
MFDLGTVGIEFGTMLFQIVAFLILLLLVKRFAFGPAMSILEKRQKHIENEIESAEKSRQETLKILEEQREVLNQARDDAHEIIERARKNSENEAKGILDEAQERAKRLVEEAKSEIEREKDKAVAVLRDQFAGLSILLASKVIEKEISEQEQKETIDQFIRQVGDRL